MIAMEKKKPKDYPFNDWTWHHLQKSKESLKRQPPSSREEKIAQAKAMRETVEKLMNKEG